MSAKLKDFEGTFREEAARKSTPLKQALEMKQAELNEAIGSIKAHEERQKALEEKLMALEKNAPAEPATEAPAVEKPAN